MRIIAGALKGRRLVTPRGDVTRPTADQVRIALMDTLAPSLPGARVLDLFAGAGGVGLEALSRGAAHATFVEQDRESAARLRETASALAPGRATVVEADALAWLARRQGPFDIAFLDPPFGDDVLAEAMRRLDAPGLLAPDAYIYVEQPAAAGPPGLPPGWLLHRSGRAGAVGYHLARRPKEPRQ